MCLRACVFACIACARCVYVVVQLCVPTVLFLCASRCTNQYLCVHHWKCTFVCVTILVHILSMCVYVNVSVCMCPSCVCVCVRPPYALRYFSSQKTKCHKTYSSFHWLSSLRCVTLRAFTLLPRVLLGEEEEEEKRKKTVRAVENKTDAKQKKPENCEEFKLPFLNISEEVSLPPLARKTNLSNEWAKLCLSTMHETLPPSVSICRRGS